MKAMKHHITYGLLSLVFALSLGACSDDNDLIFPEKEVTVTLVPELYNNTLFALEPEMELPFTLKDNYNEKVAATEDIVVSFEPCSDATELIINYNTKYNCQFAAMPAGVCSITGITIGKGTASATAKVKVDMDKYKTVAQGHPMLLPLRVKSTGIGMAESDDVIYLTAPIVKEGTDGVQGIYLTSTEPTAEVFYADPSNEKAVVFAPGGGYSTLTPGEIQMAKDTFAGQNITLCIVYYRLPNGIHTLPALDTYNSMAILKQNASRWGGKKVGVMGCSTGGHVAATVGTYAPKEVDFQVLLFPVITMDHSHTHGGSYAVLLGNNPSSNTVRALSLEKQITKDVPPTFVAYSYDDPTVNYLWNAQRYVNGLLSIGNPVVDNWHAKGGHYWGDWQDYPSAMLTWINSL